MRAAVFSDLLGLLQQAYRSLLKLQLNWTVSRWLWYDQVSG